MVGHVIILLEQELMIMIVIFLKLIIYIIKILNRLHQNLKVMMIVSITIKVFTI